MDMSQEQHSISIIGKRTESLLDENLLRKQIGRGINKKRKASPYGEALMSNEVADRPTATGLC